MTLPATPLKCAGAPLKMSFMLRDRLAQAGTLDRSSITFYSALHNVFGVPVVNDSVLQRWQALGLAPLRPWQEAVTDYVTHYLRQEGES